METSDRQNLAKIITYLLLFGIIGITLLSLTTYVGWNLILELASHFQLQYLCLSFLLLCFLAIFRQKALILIGLFCVVIILVGIVHWYLPTAGDASKTSGQVRIFLSNVNTRNQSYTKVISLVREEKPDVAIFVEVTDTWSKQLKSLQDLLPYSTERPSGYSLGSSVYSRLPLDNVAVDFFGTTRSPVILSNLTINGKVVSLIAAHPLPPVKPAFFQSRNKQLSEISRYIQQLKTPVLLIGDLNTTMWSPYYKRLVSKTGLRDARKGFGILPTWPAMSTLSPVPDIIAPLVSIPIDHCLISPGIKVVNIRTGRNVDSDHLPLITDLVISAKT